MADIAYTETPKRINFSWVLDTIFYPRKAFQRLSTITNAVWLVPLIILSLAVVINVIIAGRIKNQAALMGEITYPPDFQYYTEEQQAQYMQAIQSTQGPVFTYVLPAITSLFGIWFGWLILGGILHLVTTLLGGRGSTTLSMNIVAWASIPLALREIVQMIYMLTQKKIITAPGLSGFSLASDKGWPLILNLILGLVDLYLIWQVLLIILGARLSTGLNRTKAFFGALIPVVIILILQSGLSYLISLLGNLTITRPFFF